MTAGYSDLQLWILVVRKEVSISLYAHFSPSIIRKIPEKESDWLLGSCARTRSITIIKEKAVLWPTLDLKPTPPCG